VIVLGPLAFKFARGERGRRCNRYEVNLYKRVSPRRRAMLCPVFWCAPTGSVLIARAARPLTLRERDHLWKIEGFPDWDYMPPDDEHHPFEWKPSDWGILKGRLVALDYSAPVLFD
jgi:hypothetical protein